MSNGYTQGGYEPRFIVARTDGQPIKAERRYMVLDFAGSDPHAIGALYFYAASVQIENPQLAADIRKHLGDPVNAPPQHA